MPAKLIKATQTAKPKEVLSKINEKYHEKDKCITNVYCGPHEEEKDCHGMCCHKYVETCTFDVYMTRVRVTFNNWADGKAELMITGYANGQSALIPGMGSWIVLSQNWGWRNFNKRITSITLEKGTSRAVAISADAIEVDGWLGGRWEIGSGPVKFLDLQCGQQTGANTIEVEIRKATKPAPLTCKIEIEFMAFQVTP